MQSLTLPYPTEEYKSSGERSQFHRWLAKPEWEPRELMRYLSIYKFSHDRDDDYPELGVHDKIARALEIKNPDPAEAKRLSGIARHIMAERVAVMLDDQPETNELFENDRTAPRDFQKNVLLYNLLLLASNLEVPVVLFRPLKEMYDRKALEGKAQWTPLSNCLGAALILNQIDGSLEPVWRNMLDGKADPFIGGSPGDGIQGMLLLPTQQPPTEAEMKRMADCFPDHWAKLIGASDEHPIGSSSKVPEGEKGTEAGISLSLDFARFNFPRELQRRMPQLFEGDWLLNYARQQQWPVSVATEIDSFQVEFKQEQERKTAEARKKLGLERGQGGGGPQKESPRMPELMLAL